VRENAKAMLFRTYAILAALTFLFQIFVRIPQCASTGGCAISLGKGLLWSIVWPAGWATGPKCVS
jgi:hypothetical protein